MESGRGINSIFSEKPTRGLDGGRAIGSSAIHADGEKTVFRLSLDLRSSHRGLAGEGYCGWRICSVGVCGTEVGGRTLTSLGWRMLAKSCPEMAADLRWACPRLLAGDPLVSGRGSVSRCLEGLGPSIPPIPIRLSPPTNSLAPRRCPALFGGLVGGVRVVGDEG